MTMRNAETFPYPKRINQRRGVYADEQGPGLSDSNAMSSDPRRMTDDDGRPGAWVGRPVTHLEGWSRVTIVLMNRQIVYLDRLSADIRARTGAVVKRTEIIRALIDSLAESSVDLTAVRTEADLKRLLRRTETPQTADVPSGE